MENSRSIQISRLLRPIRLGLLLNPTDDSAVEKAIELSTCRWGGMGFSMIPRPRRRPSGFPSVAMTSTDIAEGYLNTFEPDKLAVGFGPTAEGLSVPKEAVVEASDLEESNWRGGLDWGVSALDLYRRAHAEEFRFVQHQPMEVSLPQSDEASNSLLFDALFGRLPGRGPMAFMRRGFIEAFRAEEVVLDTAGLYRILLERAAVLTPLRAAMRDLKRSPHRNFQRRPIFIVIRPAKSADIVDYWNLRALGLGLVPILAHEADLFAETYSALAAEGALGPEFRSDKNRRILIVKAQGVPSTDLDDATRRLEEAGGRIVKQQWFPPLWSAPRLKSSGHARAVLESASDRVDVTVSENQIAFKPLAPTWDVESGGVAGASYMNVIRLNDFSWEGKLAAVFPPDLRDLRSLLGTVGFLSPKATSEGIVVEVSFPDLAQHWSLPDGSRVFKAWLRGRGMTAVISSAGRTAEQIIATLGGPIRAQIVQEPKLIRLIDQAARGLPEESTNEPVSPRRRVIRYNELQRVLREVTGNDDDLMRRRLRLLVERHVLRQGLMVACSLCEQANWYSLEELASQLSCERCLQTFDFPTDRPPGRNEWAYRPSGPFSTENFADGGYAVALVMRFFNQASHIVDDITWTTSMKVKGRQLDDLEFDFGLWLREDSSESQPQLLLGECKTFGRFEIEDVERANRLAEAFPESLLVFATLNQGLEEAERESLSEIAAPGSRLDSRVVVLTANELCDSEGMIAGPQYLWDQKGGRFAEVAAKYDRTRFDLAALAAATSELYLEE